MSRRRGSSEAANRASALRIEIADSKKQDKSSHDPGWPHYDRKGNCLCKCKHCLGKSGCICKGCHHRSHPDGH